jgi:hypothetical protein
MKMGSAVIFTNSNEKIESFKEYAFQPAVVLRIHPFVYKDQRLITIKLRDFDVEITVNKIDLYEI